MRTFVGKPAALAVAVAATAVLLSAVPGVARADVTSDRIAELEKRLERSLQVIEQLSRKVERLESQRAPQAPAAAADGAIEARVSGLEQQVSAIGSRSNADDGLALHGFADVGLRTSNRGTRRGAALGNVDLYLAPQFGSSVKGLMELVFETSEDGKVDMDLERLQLGYTFSDQLTLWFGRFHTPYGYWNTAFHHGAQIQTALLRPRFLEFEDRGGILPAHGVGGWGTGGLHAGAGKLRYDAYVVNSPRIAQEDPAVPGAGALDPNLAGATSHSALVGGRVAYDFAGGLQGLTLGLHAFTAKIEDSATAPSRSRVRMAGGYGSYLEDNWEVVGEYYGFWNRNITGTADAHRSWAAYLQAGHTFGRWTPYARAERTSLDQNDNFFAAQASGQSYTRAVLGLRFDLDPRSALKLEINRTRFTDRTTDQVNEARAQYAVRF